MTVDDQAPADTSMMRIVHAALRRDLERARISATGEPSPDTHQRAAIARRLTWMIGAPPVRGRRSLSRRARAATRRGRGARRDGRPAPCGDDAMPLLQARLRGGVGLGGVGCVHGRACPIG
jgi:hypothetical protein